MNNAKSLFIMRKLPVPLSLRQTALEFQLTHKLSGNSISNSDKIMSIARSCFSLPPQSSPEKCMPKSTQNKLLTDPYLKLLTFQKRWSWEGQGIRLKQQQKLKFATKSSYFGLFFAWGTKQSGNVYGNIFAPVKIF